MNVSGRVGRTAAAAVLLVCLSALSGVAFAQSPHIRSEVDKTELTTDEVLTLTVTVAGQTGSAQDHVLPVIENVNIVGRGSWMSVTTVNNRSTFERAHEYRLRPTVDGPLTIGAVKVVIDGKTYETDPITVEVHPGVGRPAAGGLSAALNVEVSTELAGQDFYVESAVDNLSPRLGEQVTYIFRFYSAADVLTRGRPEYDGPDLTGFWTREYPDQQRYTATAAGRRYVVDEIRAALFPTIVGPRTIEPADLTVLGTFFQPTTTLRTLPVHLDVQPLPPGAPADFSGAVGRFSISARTDGDDVAANDPIVLTVTLSGEGNIDILPDPVWPDMPGWRVVDTSPPTTDSRIESGRLVGTRVYRRTLVPSEAGDFTIPPVSFTYFDPATNLYDRTSSDPIPLTVTEGRAWASAQSSSSGTERDTVQRLAADIRHIKPSPDSLRVTGVPIVERGLYWAAIALPGAVLAAAAAWRWRIGPFGSSRRSRSGQAHGRARNALESARAAGTDPYAAAGNALAAYVGDRLNQPASGLTHEALIVLLRSQGIEPDLLRRVEVCLAASEHGRFAPVSAGPASAEALIEETEALVSELESRLE